MFAAASTICALGPDKALSLMSWPEGRLQRTVIPEGASVVCMAASRQSSRLVLARADSSLAFLDVSSGKLLHLATLPASPACICASPDGEMIAVAATDGVVYVVKVSDGALVRRLECGPARCVSLSWSPGGVLAAVNTDLQATIWGADFDLVGRFSISSLPDEISLSADGRVLFVVGGSDKLTSWEIKSGRIAFELVADKSFVDRVACSHDGKLLATGGRSGFVRMWDVDSRKLLWEKPAHSGWVNGLCFSPDDGALVSCGEDRRIQALSPKTGADLTSAEGHSDAVSCIAISPDGRYLASTGFDGKVCIWRAETGELLHASSPEPQPGSAVAWSTSGDRLFSAGGSSVWTWDPKGGERQLLRQAGPGAVRGLAAVPDVGLLAGGTDTVATLFSIEGGKTLRDFEGHAAMVRAVAGVPGGRAVLTAGADGRVGIWTMGDGKTRWLDSPSGSLTSIAVAADGLRIAVGSTDAGVRIWNWQTGGLLLTIRGFDGEVTGVAFSPDGSLVAASTVGNSVRVCDTERGAQRALFRGSGGVVRAVCWGQGPTTIYSAMYDTTAVEWRLAEK
ncbi:MAG: WD40 repeat domain-containing protein [Planctomycetia bacterium]|nr:WD40 repeat domain-containing protein [Planctomycetia bacterium]